MYLQNGGLRAVQIAHRRWGKDEVCLHWAAVALHSRVGNVWHCLPEFAQARKAIWTAVNPHTGIRRIDEAFPNDIRASTNEQEMFIRFKNGSTWQVIGSDNYMNLVGTTPAGIVFSEWAKADPAAWAYLAPILVENKGWALFITTPQGRNHGKATYDLAKFDPSWHAELQTFRDSGAIPEEAVEAQRAEYHSIFGVDAGNALIEQEYNCSFEAAILGAVWGRELAQCETDGRIKKVDVDPKLPIHTAWDLGNHLNMAIWVFQQDENGIRVIDFLKGFGVGLPSHVHELNERGYRGGTDWVPHDARVKELGTEKSRVEHLIDLGRFPRLVPHLGLPDGINAARITLPKCTFDKDRCAEGLEALRQYRAEWDEKRRCFRDNQVKDWTSHPADAFRYMSLAWREMRVPAAESFEDRFRKEQETTRAAVAEMAKPKTLYEMLDELETENAED
jgi:phage terminase large subunit